MKSPWQTTRKVTLTLGRWEWVPSETTHSSLLQEGWSLNTFVIKLLHKIVGLIQRMCTWSPHSQTSERFGTIKANRTQTFYKKATLSGWGFPLRELTKTSQTILTIIKKPKLLIKCPTSSVRKCNQKKNHGGHLRNKIGNVSPPIKIKNRQAVRP